MDNNPPPAPPLPQQQLQPAPLQHLLQQQRQQLQMFWTYQRQEIEHVNDFKNHQLLELNLCRLNTIMKSLHAKAAWAIMQRSSAWASFMSRKYYGVPNGYGSRAWKALSPIIESLKANSMILIGNGGSQIWDTLWCNPVVPRPYGYPHNHTIREVLENDTLRSAILQMLPDHAQGKLLSISLSDCEDKLVWTGHKSGAVSAKGFREFFAPPSQRNRAWERIWIRQIPKKISWLLWKIRHNVVPLDEILQSRGLCLASRCRCCPQGCTETFEHVFVHGNVALKIWSWLGNMVNLQPPSSFQCLTSEWFLRQNRRSEAGMMRILSFAIGVWEIWKQRCVAMFDSPDVEVPDEVVRWRITSLLRIRMDNFKPKFAASTTDLDILKRFGVVGKPIAARRLDQSLWLPSSIGSTINIACLQNIGAAILRSPDGSLIVALAMKLSPYAELDGLPTLLKSLIARSDNSGSNLPTEIQWDTTIAPSSLAWSIRPMKHMRSKMIPKRCNGAVHDLLCKVVARGEDLADPLWLSPSDLPLSTALIIEHDKSKLSNSS